ncbi:gamma-aminobutyric acid receptor subunit beta-like isoform X2 [Paramacrobiotus metropolitanus]|uniref:gamma-aminobutyric acid receptor subunit beta-like isoform X2 n=1 Tax=Paramacrobiotus metropolitanus TaxID=2943436 RepID=UPI00244576E2|nr:gamma-aminobutyric acid receptor subunit beta-like isoform X2 [Paramacrobiotus metropolitanus]
MSINIWILFWISNTILFLTFKAVFTAKDYISDLEKLDLENMTHILRNLSRSYDIRLRPGFGGPSLHLDMELSVASFESISEVNMDYTLTLYLRQYWRDDRLAFAPNTNVQITLSGDFANQIWVPDTFLANDKHSFLHDVTEKNKMVRLSGDGDVEYGMRFTTTLACMMDLHYYPLDTQNCTVEIESYGYTTADVNMTWKNGTNSIHDVRSIDIPQFTIDHYETYDNQVTLATGAYQRLFLKFTLKRNIGYFVFQTYLPCILIVMLSWVSFWINHEATSARVALASFSPCSGITTVLTMTTISTGVRSNLPRISYVKAIDIYLVKCFVFVFAALLEYALVNYTYWGARAKKKAKKFKQQSIPEGRQPRTIYSDGGMLGFDDIRMSPIPSLRKRQMQAQNSYGQAGVHMDTNTINASITRKAIPPSSIMRSRAANYPSTTSYPDYARRPRPIGHSAQKRRMFQSVRKRFTTMQKVLPKIQDVNKIDRYSRLCFPLTFFICNLVYWCFYTFI